MHLDATDARILSLMGLSAWDERPREAGLLRPGTIGARLGKSPDAVKDRIRGEPESAWLDEVIRARADAAGASMSERGSPPVRM